MPRAASFAFPPFTRTVKTLIGINVGVYFLMKIMALSGQEEGLIYIFRTFALIPSFVVHGRIWQVFTYSFLHAGLFHVLFNMLSLWMFGSTLEQHWGRRQFLEFYFLSVAGGALTTIAIAYAGHGLFGLLPDGPPTVGASAGVYGLLLAFGWFFGEQDVFMFPLPFSMKAKYMVGILIIIALAGALGDAGGTANIAHLGGLLFAFLYLKFLPPRGFAFVFSEGFYGMRNSYHRWKRDRAKKKFQVYMRKHTSDPRDYFDQYGNFRPPEDLDKKKDDSKGGWVN
jgi:membrane associated rhomboid family serine protease